MIIDDLQAVELLKKYQKLPHWVHEAREYDVKMNALVNGKNVKELLIKIEHIEDTKKAIARKKYARGIRDLNDKLLRPIDNIFAATGGTKEYNIQGEEFKKELLSKVSKIRDNKSLENWLKTYWAKPLLHGQPNGLIFMEWKDENVYPTFKSIGSIRYYQQKGQNIDFVIFEPENKKIKEFEDQYKIEIPGNKEQNIELWRIVDDKMDRRYTRTEAGFIPFELLTFPNPFKECPGVICSPYYDFNCEHRVSPIHSIVEVEEEYLRDQSIKTIFKFKHGFSIFWRYAIICPTCHGRGKTGTESCKECDGKGYYATKDITDEAVIPIPTSNEQVKIAPDIAGYISPDIEIWTQYNVELKLLRDEMYATHWGSEFIQEENQTATGRFIDVQPVKNKLNDYADISQWVEWQLTEWIAKFINPTIPQSKTTSIIIYGRNYLIEAPDEILTRYQDSKTKGDPITILDRLLKEYLTTKFKNDPENLRLNLIKFEIEPYPHYDIPTVKDIFGIREAQRKMMFADWWEGMRYEEIKVKESKDLIVLFDAFVTEKLGAQPKDTTTLAVKLGVGGTQSLQLIITDPTMSPESKRATLEILFGILPEEANRLVPKTKIEPL